MAWTVTDDEGPPLGAASTSRMTGNAERVASVRWPGAGWRGSPTTGDDHSPTHNGRFYAELAVRYDTLVTELGGRGGARARLAAHYKFPLTTVENWIKEAKDRGMWVSGGRGKTGQATELAYKTTGASR